jgi:hypothetical protein
MKRSIPTGAWIAGGLVAAAMLAPGIAYATATMTQIVGTNGTTVAQVSKAKQLYVAPSDPNTVVSFSSGYDGSTTSSCLTLATPPTGKALVITDIRYSVSKGSPADHLYLTNTVGCGAGGTVIDAVLPAGNGEYTFPAGLPVHATSALSFHVANSSGTEDDVTVYADGYTVPSTVLP